MSDLKFLGNFDRTKAQIAELPTGSLYLVRDDSDRENIKTIRDDLVYITVDEMRYGSHGSRSWPGVDMDHLVNLTDYTTYAKWIEIKRSSAPRM